MTNVAPFSYARFTPGDLKEFDRISRSKLRTGIWKEVLRQSDRKSDRLVAICGLTGMPVFQFERGADGYVMWYFHKQCKPNPKWVQISCSQTAEQCLSIMKMKRSAA